MFPFLFLAFLFFLSLLFSPFSLSSPFLFSFVFFLEQLIHQGPRRHHSPSTSVSETPRDLLNKPKPNIEGTVNGLPSLGRANSCSCIDKGGWY